MSAGVSDPRQRVVFRKKHDVGPGLRAFINRIDVLSAVNDGDSLLRQQLALLITSVDSCC